MTRFDETVAKIAASPAKRALLKHVPSRLFKQAGIGDIPGAVGRGIGRGIGGAARGAYDAAKGARKWLTDPASGKSPLGSGLSGLVSGGLVGAGAWGTGKLLDNIDQSSDRMEAERKQMGQLSGEQKFRTNALQGLSPLHDQVFSTLGQDQILAKADPELVHSTYQTMKRFAPHLAADPNAARSFLRESALYGTGPSYAALKTLADAEQSVSRAGAMGA